MTELLEIYSSFPFEQSDSLFQWRAGSTTHLIRHRQKSLLANNPGDNLGLPYVDSRFICFLQAVCFKWRRLSLFLGPVVIFIKSRWWWNNSNYKLSSSTPGRQSGLMLVNIEIKPYSTFKLIFRDIFIFYGSLFSSQIYHDYMFLNNV